jgi:hypothetical protein
MNQDMPVVTRYLARHTLTASQLLRVAIACLALHGASVVHAAPASLVLSCNDSFQEPAEHNRIAQAGGGLVRRVSKDRLIVQVAGKMLQLDNNDPEDNNAGLRFGFCERRDGWILLHHADSMRFTGVLINETTGAQIPAGETVAFSYDRRAYFATRQPDGLDGEEWEIHFADGRVSWTGFSFIRNPDSPNYAYAELDEPHWLSSGVFVARATCMSDRNRQWRVMLSKNAYGQWDWDPIKPCPAEK